VGMGTGADRERTATQAGLVARVTAAMRGILALRVRKPGAWVGWAGMPARRSAWCGNGVHRGSRREVTVSCDGPPFSRGDLFSVMEAVGDWLAGGVGVLMRGWSTRYR
jgi:hypothetical protein